MTNGWTGGQYSLFRVAFGLYLAVHFFQLAPWGPELFSREGMIPSAAASPLAFLFPNVLVLADSPAVVVALLLAGGVLSLLLALGAWDRAAAVGIWYVWACLLGRNPLILNPGIPYVGWLLLAHALLPPAPCGSVAARRRAVPGGSWRMTPAIFAGAWILMALGYSYSGYAKLVSPSWLDGTALARVLENPLARPGFLREAVLSLPDPLLKGSTWAALSFELLFAPLALSARLRPWLWAAALGMHVSLIALIDFADLSMGMVMLHLFTLDPGWIAPAPARVPETIFYDGQCGLCHRSVRFVLAEDRRPGAAFRFAPLGGEAFVATIAPSARRDLPDSLVVATEDGRLLTRAAAALHIARRLGGVWRVVAVAAGLAPVRGLDRAYDFVARVRGRLFASPEKPCPIVGKDLQSRLLS